MKESTASERLGVLRQILRGQERTSVIFLPGRKLECSKRESDGYLLTISHFSRPEEFLDEQVCYHLDRFGNLVGMEVSNEERSAQCDFEDRKEEIPGLKSHVERLLSTIFIEARQVTV